MRSHRVEIAFEHPDPGTPRRNLLPLVVALAIVWLAIAASSATDRPIGSFVGLLSAAAYLLTGAWDRLRRRRPAATMR